MRLSVQVVSPSKVLFQGYAKSVMVPGEQGVFEVTLFHKGIVSRLVSGVVFVDENPLRIKRGAITASENSVTIVCEPA